MEYNKVVGESDKDYAMRLEIIKLNKNIKNIELYSKLWVNVNYHGCKYPEEAISDLDKLKIPKK